MIGANAPKSTMPQLRITLPPETTNRDYDIVNGHDGLPKLGKLMAERLGRRRCFVISDQVVSSLHLPTVEKSIEAAGHTLGASTIMAAGEKHKNIKNLERVLAGLLSQHLDRQCLIIALGGGVVGDVAGLAAALALRGIDYVQVPTSLLAMVDSSVGGKTAIDHAAGKNLIGAFHQPRLVVCDLDVLKTLPPREWRCGYAEVFKYGAIMDAAFFEWCENYGAALLAGKPDVIVHAVETSCALKANIVSADEKENGLRAILNFGHTFGHAFETHYMPEGTLQHGEAVAVGMVYAARLSEKLGHAPQGTAPRIIDHLNAVHLPTRLPDVITDTLADTLLRHMKADKKTTGGQLNFVLLKNIGQAFVAKNIDAAVVKDVLMS